ncbi:MAG: biotin/lipoyl-binding protein, partial [Cyanobacteria bacterium P01_D01_bin.2]
MTSQLSNNGIPAGQPGNNSPQPFDQPVILRQSPVWSQAIVWAILGVTSITILWAFLAKVEETIPAQGKLEPVGVVQPVQTPNGGVIEKIHVKEGDLVEEGDVLITFNQSAARAELESLLRIREQLNDQTEVYRAQNSGDGNIPITGDLQQRLEEKNELEASNRIYQAQIDGDMSGLSATAIADVSSARGEVQEQ